VRYELSDFEWAAIKPLLPNKWRCVRRVNDRRVLNGIFWVLRSGPHALRIHPQMLDFPARTIQTQSAPENAGTKHLANQHPRDATKTLGAGYGACGSG
jgi:transposase